MDNRLEILEKYNFWNKNQPKEGFLRESYTEKIIKYTGNNLIKVLTGQRRTGKSYIMRQLALQLVRSGVNKKNICYINLEMLDFGFIKNYSDLDLLVKLYKSSIEPKGRVYLFIDEVQNVDGWEKLVNSYSQDYTEDIEIFISGSNSKMLSGELATLLSGRYINFTVFPLSFEEYCGISRCNNDKQAYLDYLQTGGMPELFRLKDEEVRRNYIRALKDSVMLRDIIQRYRVSDPILLEDVFSYLVNNASSIISVNNITNYFKSNLRKTSYDTISNYIGYFEDAFLVHRAERYNIKGKEILGGNKKYYINDLSFSNFLYKGFGYGLGYKLENLIYLDLLRAGYDVYVGEINKKEVDFVAIKADKKLYVQCTYMLVDESTIEREYSSLLSIKDSYPKFVVSLDDLKLNSNQGIEHIQAWKFAELCKKL
jgi:hypothetical protein